MDFGGAYSVGSAIGQIGVNYFNNRTARAQADTANYIRNLNNGVKKVENERDAVITATQRWRQSVYNDRVKEHAATDREVIETNFWRQRDARQRASFSDQIRYAEQEGRMAAAAAMSGVSGSVVDMLENTAKLRKGIEDQTRAEAESQFGYDKNKLEFGTYQADMDQFDYSLIFDHPQMLDFTRNIPQTVSLLNGVTGAQVKGIAQGFDFSFGSKPSPTQGVQDSTEFFNTGGTSFG